MTEDSQAQLVYQVPLVLRVSEVILALQGQMVHLDHLGHQVLQGLLEILETQDS